MADPELRAWRPTRDRVLWLTAALTLVVVPHALRIPLWITLVFAGLAAWRTLHAHGRVRLAGRWLRVGMSLVLALGVLATYGTLFGREAGVALMVALAGMKLIEMRDLRDAFVVCYLACFLIITNFLFSQSIPAGLYMAPTLVVLTAAFITLSTPTETLGSLARLRLAGSMLVQALPIMLVLFVLFPRIPGPLWGLPEDARGGVSGLDDTMTPGSIRRLGLSDAVAFRVAFHGDPPAPSARYWRGPVLWHTDGRRWSAGEPHTGREVPGGRAVADAVAYTVTLEPHQRRWLFALELPGSVPEGARITDDFQLLAGEPVRERRRYRVRSYPRYRNTHLAAGHRGDALQLPSGAHPRARALARRWRGAAGDDDRALVTRALAYFREQPFGYTLTPPPISGDPVDGFLFETRRGFCEYYAGAFTVLMRAAGIPARVITGYQGGELNPLGDYLIVRQRDAHAWTEVWLPDSGWVRVDPTAAVSPSRIERGMEATLPAPIGVAGVALPESDTVRSLWRTLRNGWDAINNVWNQWVLGYGPERQSRVLGNLGLERGDWIQLALALGGAVGGVLAGVALWLWRRGRPGDPVVEAYADFCRKLARAGVVREPTEGPVALARRAARERPQLAPEVRRVTALYVRLRYGDGRARINALRRAVAEFRP